MEDFLWRALIAGLGIALLAAPLGCFVVWQRMAYFGETVAHAGLLGLSLGIITNLPASAAIFLTSLLVAFGLKMVQRTTLLAKDTALGLIAHVVLATGLIVASQFQALQIDMMSLLFGDILAVTIEDLWLVLFGLIVVWGLIYLLWEDLLMISIDPEMAAAEGVPIGRMNLILAIAIALTVALAMKLVGLLLVTAMMIIPAAGAMNLSRTPEQMAVIAAGLSLFSVICGFFLSLYFDVPTGPLIVVMMAVLFILSTLRRAFR